MYVCITIILHIKLIRFPSFEFLASCKAHQSPATSSARTLVLRPASESSVGSPATRASLHSGHRQRGKRRKPRLLHSVEANDERAIRPTNLPLLGQAVASPSHRLFVRASPHKSGPCDAALDERHGPRQRPLLHPVGSPSSQAKDLRYVRSP